jgi:hypothetical protein
MQLQSAMQHHYQQQQLLRRTAQGGCYTSAQHISGRTPAKSSQTRRRSTCSAAVFDVSSGMVWSSCLLTGHQHDSTAAGQCVHYVPAACVVKPNKVTYNYAALVLAVLHGCCCCLQPQSAWWAV